MYGWTQNNVRQPGQINNTRGRVIVIIL